MRKSDKRDRRWNHYGLPEDGTCVRCGEPGERTIDTAATAAKGYPVNIYLCEKHKPKYSK